ncbi:selenium-binding protein SBP56-related protein [Ensifer canadensis]
MPSRTGWFRKCCSVRNTAAGLHFWDLHKRKHLQEIDFGEEHQLVFELRPAHDPTKAYGFVGCVISLKDLSAVDLDLVS